jgi:hypothetical protein
MIQKANDNGTSVDHFIYIGDRVLDAFILILSEKNMFKCHYLIKTGPNSPFLITVNRPFNVTHEGPPIILVY